MKRILAALLVLALVLGLTLTACSKKEEKEKEKEPTGENKTPEKEEPEDTSEGKLVFDQDTTLTLGEPQKKLDPKTVYDNLTYTPEMFYGDYRILGGKEGKQAYAKEMSYVDCQVYNYKNESVMERITAVPYRLEVGPHTLNHIISGVNNRDFLRAYFYSEDGNLNYNLCAYTVSGNTLTITPLALYEYNRENNHIRYILSETVLTYQFRFEGRKLTLTNGKDSVSLYTGLSYDSDETWLDMGNYVAADSPKLNNLDYIGLSWHQGDKNDVRHMSAEVENAKNWEYPYAVMEDNGMFTMTMNVGETAVTQQFVYFYCGNDGVILTDGENTYYYNATYSDRFGDKLDGSLSFEDMNKLENMDKEKLEQIVETKANLLTDLGKAFRDAGIAVSINEETGEIAMDAAVLFPVGEYTVSEEGKALLQKFIGVYTGAVFDQKYENFLSKIMVEGHTDSTGDYDKNQILSQNRANSVKTLCLEYGGEYAAKLTDMLQAVGYSSDNLIYDASGKEDQTASRRVCFRFIINLNG